MRLYKLLRTLPPLVLLMTGFLAVSQVQAQEESAADERKAWQQFNQEFNRHEVQDGQERQLYSDDIRREPTKRGIRQELPEYLLRIFRLTPELAPKGEFRSIKGTPASTHVANGSVWEKDRARHGGAAWKVWLHEIAWSNGQKPYTLDKDGNLLRLPKRT